MVPRVHVAPEDIHDGVARIRGDAAAHVSRVLRLSVGDELVVFDGEGGEYPASVARMRRGEVVARLGERRAVDVELPAPLVLIQGLAKAPAMDRVVRSAVELGAAAILPAVAARSVPKAGGHKAERWRRIASEAAAQCGRARVPDVADAVPFSDALGRSVGCLLMPWEGEAGHPMAHALAGADLSRGVTVLVGPEGGWTVEEAEEVRSLGGLTVTLGARTLRVDTAVVAALALAASAIESACGSHGPITD